MNITQNIPAIDLQDLRNQLPNGVAKFAYIKKDGSLRLATGTLKLESVPQAKHPKGVRESSPKVLVYFDLERQDWRSVSIDTLVFGTPTPKHREIREIAKEIDTLWNNIYFGARPYLCAMLSLTDKHSTYGLDSAVSIVQYFLSNASGFRGVQAKRLKAELKEVIK
jgi:hypothetical protein